MENKGYSTIPRILFESITFLSGVLPVRSAPTFIELLIGTMLTQAGFATEAWLAINPFLCGAGVLITTASSRANGHGLHVVCSWLDWWLFRFRKQSGF